MREQSLKHPIPPTWNEHSEVLILGSFPSVKSREMGYFYGHPQNRFWKVLAGIFHEDVPQTIEERRAFLLRNHIAVWDVLASCRITGSSDSSIRDAVPNDIRPILTGSQIHKICCNGRKSHDIYRKYMEPQTGLPSVCLPSTSPANAAWSLERLIQAWGAELR